METPLTLLASAVPTLTAGFGFFWLTRVRAARRLRAAADAYAQREIAREAYWRARKTVPAHATRT